MLQPITDLLMLIMQPCYDLTGNWWISILLFTCIVKVILFPMSLWCQKNSIVMVQLMPDLNRIKVKYFGDQETIGEAQNKMYKEKHYHPLLSLIPLAVQILILFGLVDVVHYITDNGFEGTEFLGMTPTVDGGLSWIMPVLAGLSAVVMGFAQNRINPLQKEQSKAEKNMTNGLSIGLSLILGIFVAAGMCFYWICSNLTSIVIQALCNICIKPKKYIDYEDLQASREELEELENLGGPKKKWYQRDPLAKREKADYKRFFNVVNKHLVVYSEGGGFYRYMQGMLEYLLAHSTVTIHYITSDPNDPVFALSEQQPRICPYYIGQQKSITMFMKMDCDIMLMTIEDLDNYYLKRSYIRKDINYVFTVHHMTSTFLASQENAFDHYDTILCAGPHQVSEIRAREKQANLPAKKLVECGYDLLDRAIEARKNVGTVKRPTIVIGPSWQEDNILDSCIDDMLQALLGHGWRIIVRPHPEYVKRYRPRWEALQQRWAQVSEDDLYFEKDFSSNESVYTSNLMITDWSSISCEFSFSTLKPTLFIDTPMKVSNKNWKSLGITPTDITLRNEIGVSFDPKNLTSGKFEATVADIIENPDKWASQISSVRSKFIYNLGKGGEVAGEYLLRALLEKQGNAVVNPPHIQKGTPKEPNVPAGEILEEALHAKHARV